MQSSGRQHAANRFFSSPLVRKYLLALICAVLTVRTVLFFVRAARVVLYPYEWSTMDGYFVYHGLRLLSGQPIYFGYESILTPFEYVPLYPAVIGTLAKVFGVGVWYERVFGVACAVGMAAIIFRTVMKSRPNRTAALCAALMFFAPATLSVWFLVRGIDIFAALLALAGVAVAANEDRPGKQRLIWATLLLVLAFYAKQTALLPAAGVVVYVMSREFKRGLAMGLGFGLAVAGLLLLFQRMSGGWFFENTFVTTSMNPYYPRQLVHFWRDFALILFVALPVALVRAWRGVGRRPDIWTLYFLFTLLLTFLAAKVGAALSYFLPLLSAVCIHVGLWLADDGLFERRPRVYGCVLLLLLVQSVSFFADRIPIPTREDYRQAEKLDAQIRAHPGPLLIERIDSFATRSGRELNVEAVQLPVLIMRRTFDPLPLLNAVDDKEFSLIVYSGIYFGGIPALKRSIFENYRVIDQVQIGLFVGETTFLVLAPS